MVRIFWNKHNNEKVNGHGDWFPLHYFNVLSDLCGEMNKKYPFLNHQVQFN